MTHVDDIPRQDFFQKPEFQTPLQILGTQISKALTYTTFNIDQSDRVWKFTAGGVEGIGGSLQAAHDNFKEIYNASQKAIELGMEVNQQETP